MVGLPVFVGMGNYRTFCFSPKFKRPKVFLIKKYNFYREDAVTQSIILVQTLNCKWKRFESASS